MLAESVVGPKPKIEEEIDEHVENLCASIDGVLSHEMVKPWLDSVAPSEAMIASQKQLSLRRREMTHFALHRRNFIPLFTGCQKHF